MITYIKGNIFQSKANVLINPVNCLGVMGKGLALEFKNKFPKNYQVYRKECIAKRVNIGKVLAVKEGDIYIINFPTKFNWNAPSEYSYIDKGLENLKAFIKVKQWKHLACPKIGCGLGGLDWNIVKCKLEETFKEFDGILEVYI